jgi:hypothetical protein
VSEKTPSVGTFDPKEQQAMLGRAMEVGTARLTEMAREVADGTADDATIIAVVSALSRTQLTARLDGISSMLMNMRPDSATDIARGIIGMPIRTG